MQPLTLPIQHADAQQAIYLATVESTEPAPAKSIDPVLINSAIVLLVLGGIAAIVSQKRHAKRLQQQTQRLEKLWRLESYSPSEEHQ